VLKVGKQTYISRVIADTRTPTWNQSFSMAVQESDKLLEMEIRDKDLFARGALAKKKVDVRALAARVKGAQTGGREMTIVFPEGEKVSVIVKIS
jgi:hypothetical protein